MAKVLGFARAFVGRWRILVMDNRDTDFLDLVDEAHLRVRGKSDGESAFGTLKGFLAIRDGAKDGSACGGSHGKSTTRMPPPAFADGL
ncbi:hypothetical protein N2602_32305 [Bradyrhizobium sp. NC92]|nr:hypothetical protein N2602_32305 [Bradyrhizobium sp. NC92]